MNTLDTLVQETLKRIEAAGGRAWLPSDSSDDMKMAFLEMLMECPECKHLVNTNSRISN